MPLVKGGTERTPGRWGCRGIPRNPPAFVPAACKAAIVPARSQARFRSCFSSRKKCQWGHALQKSLWRHATRTFRAFRRGNVVGLRPRITSAAASCKWTAPFGAGTLRAAPANSPCGFAAHYFRAEGAEKWGPKMGSSARKKYGFRMPFMWRENRKPLRRKRGRIHSRFSTGCGKRGKPARGSVKKERLTLPKAGFVAKRCRKCQPGHRIGIRFNAA